MQSLRSDGILVPCKVAGLDGKPSARCSIAAFRPASRPRDELAKLKAQYAELTHREAPGC